jgi:ribonucleoside-diphosphate reductase alpha chain
MDHVRMQAAARGITAHPKTINVPEDDFQSFKDVYMAAWDQGCKGCNLSSKRSDRIGAVRFW